jgi:Zn-dependent protease
MDLARLPREETQPMTVQTQKPDEYTITYAPVSKRNNRVPFSRKETVHLMIATLLVIAVGLSYTDLPSSLFSRYAVDYPALIVFVIIFSTSFLMHEMAHKLVAQKQGYWAEFRLTLIGAALTLLSVISTIFKIISPGAVMIGGPPDRERMGRISIAGPLTNIALSVIFLGANILAPYYRHIILIGVAFNGWIALFNLIPYGIFDGLKVFIWDKRIWISAFALSLALTAVSYVLIS